MREFISMVTYMLICALVGAVIVAPIFTKIESRNKPCDYFVKEDWTARNVPYRCFTKELK